MMAGGNRVPGNLNGPLQRPRNGCADGNESALTLIKMSLMLTIARDPEASAIDFEERLLDCGMSSRAVAKVCTCK